MNIVRVLGREIYDSRGWPTILCEVWLDDSTVFTGYAPAGGSRSTYQAHEQRDGDKRLWGKGVRKAVAIIDELIAPVLVGKEPRVPELDFALIDLDGTPNKSRLGSNVLVAVSMALYKAHAYTERVELYELCAYLIGADSVTLPCPQFTIINAEPINKASQGPHANLCIQEYLIAPMGAATLQEAMEACFTIHHELKDILRGKGKWRGISDKGGFIAHFKDDHEVLDMLVESIERAALGEHGTCAIAIDVAANQLFDASQNKYIVRNQVWSSQDLVTFYNELVQMYPIYSIEDGLSEDDWDGWRLITETLGDRIQVVGDDVFATSPERLSSVSDVNVATAVSIKPNQIGTVTEAIQMINLCKQYQLNAVISHRSGETEDPFIADLAVGTSAGQIKAGGCARSDCLSKYNRLLAIEEALVLQRSRF